LNIVFVYADNKVELNTSVWRCFIPAEAIDKLEGHSAKAIYTKEFVENSEETQKLCLNADIIIVERNFFGDILASMMYWKVRNKIVAGNFDDAYDKMHPANATYKFWALSQGEVIENDKKVTKQIEPPPLKQFKWGLNLVAGALVPSRVLVDDWKDYTEMHYCPNYPDTKRYQNLERQDHTGIIIGWGGSLSHFQSFDESGVLKALIRVCKKHDNVRIMIAGDKRVYDKVKLDEGKKMYQNFVPFERWPTVVNNFDIGLAPLSGDYDRRRSWIKPLEYMLLGIPWVATDNGAYDELKDHGELIKNGYFNWEKAIDLTIEEFKIRKEKAMDVSQKFALEQDITKNTSKLIKQYHSIIKRGYK